MSARAATVEDRDWWMPHAMLGAFAVLVAAILRILFGWSAPLHVWLAMAGFAMAMVSVDAAWRVARACARRRWRDAGWALAVTLLLALTGATLAGAGHFHPASAPTFDVSLDEAAR